MSENILWKIGGQYVAEVLNTLPNAEKSKEDFIETVTELGIRQSTFYMPTNDCQQGKNRARF